MKKRLSFCGLLTLLSVFSMQVFAQTTNHTETLNIHVTTPGTLGDLVLAQTENFSDVKYFTVSGTLNDADLTNITKRMTSLITLNMREAVVNEMPESGFWDNKVITTVTLPKTLLTISRNLFYGCENLGSITFPPNLRKIDDSAFYNCSSLTSLSLPQTVDTLGSSAFHNCSNLVHISLPAHMTEWESSVFEYCTSLNNVTIPDGLTIISSYAFYYCESLTSIVIPAGIKTIEGHAFSGCESLTSVTLPEGLVDIEGSFQQCSALTEIDLPSTLRGIGSAFIGCDNLTTIRCHAINPPYCPNHYTNGQDLGPADNIIYVPAPSLNIYKQRACWDLHTIKPLSDLPPSLSFYTDMTLNLPATLPTGYKPSMQLAMDTHGSFGTYHRNKYYYPAVTVNGTATLSLSDFHAEYETRYHEGNNPYDNYYVKKLNSSLISNAPIRADQVSLTINRSYATWYFFSLPFNALVSEMEFAQGSDYVIYEYSGAKRAAAEFDDTWQRIPANGTLEAGKGYIMRSSNPNEAVTFHAINDNHKNDIFRRTESVVPLEEHLSDFAHNRSWNFIGNPYPCYYDTRLMEFDAPFVVWDVRDRQYATYTPYDDDYVLSPGEGFFLQRPLDQASIYFPLDGRQGSAEVVERGLATSRRAAAAAHRTVYNLTLTAADGSTDRTRLVLNPQATTAFDYGCDATKFASLDRQVPQLYTLADGVTYSINERPIADGVVILGMKAATAGTYTFSLSTSSQDPAPLTLVDHETGERTLLTFGGSYTFHALAGTSDSRFTLEVGDVVTDVQSVATESPQTLPAYDLQGRRIGSSLSPLTKGIYIIGGKKHIVK